jgi:hypothetical protein
MSDRARPTDPGAVWRDQPEEAKAVKLEQIVNRRTEGLYASTRSEILMSIGAALLLAGVMAVRFAPYREPLLLPVLAAIVVWVAASLVWFRGRIFHRDPPRPDTAAPGIEYYRRELERRRDHLRNGWVWNGPLFLACLMLAVTLTGRKFLGFDRFASALPLVAVLVLWTAYSFRRRRLLAKELQREIDDLKHQ